MDNNISSYNTNINIIRNNKSFEILNSVISRIFVFIIILIMMLYPSSVIGISTYIPYYLIGTIVLIDVLGKETIRLPNFLYYLLGFCLWSIFINLFMTPYNGYGLFFSVRTSIGIIFPVLAFILGSKYGNKVDINIMSKIVFILLFIQSIIVFLQMLGTGIGFETYWIYGGEKGLLYLQYLEYGKSNYQAIGTLGNPNELGVFAVVLLAFLFFCNKINKLFYITSVLLSLYIVFSSQSRTAVILFAILIFIRMAFSKYRSPLKTILKPALGIIAMIIILAYASNNLGRALGFDQLNPRFILWENALNMVFSYGAEVNFLFTLFGRGVSYVKSMGSVDNTYLNILLSSGLIGLTFLIIFVYKLMFQAKQIYNLYYRYLAYSYILVFLVSGIVIDVYFNMKVSFFLFFVLGYILNYDRKIINQSC